MTTTIYSVMAGGEVTYFTQKREAIMFARQYHKDSEKSIDVEVQANKIIKERRAVVAVRMLNGSEWANSIETVFKLERKGA